jgi:hypothetical protein
VVDGCADTSDDITGVSPVAASAQDNTPDLTFTGAVAAASSRIGFAANSGGCGSPSYVFTYATAPATIAAIDTKDTYVVCYSIDGGLTYTEQTTFGDAFVVEGSYGARSCVVVYIIGLRFSRYVGVVSCFKVAWCGVVRCADDLWSVSPVATIAKDSTPNLTFTGCVAATSSRIGFAANSGGCGSPSYVFQYATAPATIAAIDIAGTYVVCYSIDGGLTYTEQTTFGGAFVVQGLWVVDGCNVHIFSDVCHVNGHIC